MRNYELVFIVHPELEDSAFNEIVDRVQSWITDGGGKVLKVDIWGKRQLAYPIRKQTEGQYVLVQSQIEPSRCAELERNLNIQEPILRYLLTTTEK